MTIQFIEEYIDQKIKEDPNYIVCTFFDLRVRHNLSEEEIFEFLNLSKNKLKNIGYMVYFKGDKYMVNHIEKKVKDNELMVAIRKREELFL